MSLIESTIGVGETDPVRLWIRSKQSYAAKRGSLRATQLALDSQGRPYMLAGDTFPRTSYYDVAMMAGTWAKATRHTNTTSSVARAYADWLRSMPNQLASAVNMITSYDDYSKLASYLQTVASLKNVLFPNNEAFWGSGKVLAIAMSASHAVVPPFNLAVESVVEAVKDRVNDIAEWAPCVRLDCLVPSWVIWATVAAGGLWLYSKLGRT